AHLRQDVHHARSETDVRHHGDTLRDGAVVQRALLLDDGRVATQIGEVDAGVYRELGEREVEIVRDRTHYRVRFAHDGEHRFAIANVNRGGDEALAGVRREEGREVIEAQVREAHLSDLRILKQVVSTRR